MHEEELRGGVCGGRQPQLGPARAGWDVHEVAVLFAGVEVHLPQLHREPALGSRVVDEYTCMGVLRASSEPKAFWLMGGDHGVVVDGACAEASTTGLHDLTGSLRSPGIAHSTVAVHAVHSDVALLNVHGLPWVPASIYLPSADYSS